MEDRRGTRRIPTPVKFGGGAAILAVAIALLLGQDPTDVLETLGGGAATTTQAPSQQPPANDKTTELVSVVLADLEDIWGKIFLDAGERYPQPKLVLFSDQVQSACGFNTAATGPFYCPADRKLYIDLSFMRQLERMGGEASDFALAYIIGHEVGHHVQNVVGTSSEVTRRQRAARSRAQANQLSVRLELQADCYAGVWAHHSYNRGNIQYDESDFREGMRTAAAIGDDHLQKQAGRRVQPETYTHGTSEQRMTWLRRGLETGSIRECDTFAG